jgi:hypothetical protein
MKKSLSFFAAAAIATVVLLSVPSSAKAQPAFSGTFRGPHGAFSIGVDPFVPQVGAFVPSPFFDEVYLDPDFGYGFYYDSQWIPCTRYGSRWIIAERPVIFGRGFAQGHRSFRSNRDFGRNFVQRDFGRRDFGRREFQGQGRREFQGQGRREFQGQGRREFQGQGRREFQGQGRREFQGQDRREFQGQGRQDRGSRGNGNRQSNRDTRRRGDGRQ